jgi:hypothetical protein
MRLNFDNGCLDCCAVVAGRGVVHQRLARWILMAHDRTGDNTLPQRREN